MTAGVQSRADPERSLVFRTRHGGHKPLLEKDVGSCSEFGIIPNLVYFSTHLGRFIGWSINIIGVQVVVALRSLGVKVVCRLLTKEARPTMLASRWR